MNTTHHDNDEYRDMALFAECTPAAVAAATQTTTRVWFPAGKQLAAQRRPCRQFALIINGTVAVQRDDDEIEVLAAGDHFGEFTLLRGLAHPTTLVARTLVTVDVVSAPEFWRTYAANPTLRDRIEHECDRRIRDWVRSPIPAANQEPTRSARPVAASS